ncbi:MAG TPA: recombination mediator RecR [Oscillospiraceae bacterium]|nr:recombination mediator RecR [Oscillospiraceae bacterium]HPF55218.1 recombination mediator RecR [Clostridiales bacterium]HPK36036.1 recombination mediator RecR [Oscillospiraceae bacterium]HPR75967.1 recombination mediator RecR [Oscillospiraceae bacterium]
MRYEITALEELTEQFRKLPGIGGKNARRIALHILGLPKDDSKKLADTILTCTERIRRCSVCQNLSDEDVCPICKSEDRDRSTICVVQYPQDMLAVERTGEYNGLYHVLYGVLSPSCDVKPSDLTIKQLVQRLGDGTVKEIILATGTTAEGEVTAIYLSNLLKPIGVKITRLAYGIPVGGELEYADEMTMLRAIEGRIELGG